jgi:hypothetical protein
MYQTINLPTLKNGVGALIGMLMLKTQVTRVINFIKSLICRNYKVINSLFYILLTVHLDVILVND